MTNRNRSAASTAFLSATYLLVLSSLCWGHGSPIKVRAATGKLAVNLDANGLPLFETGTLEHINDPDIIYGDSPGIGIDRPTDGVASNTMLGLDVVSSLYYWNGLDVSPSPSDLQIYGPASTSLFYTVTENSGVQQGLMWDQYNGSFGWHSHGLFVLENGAAPGIYGATVQITANGYQASTPFLLTWKYDPTNDFIGQPLEDGVKALQAYLFSSPDLNGDGLVDGFDIGFVFGKWTQRGLGDINKDHVIDGADVAAIFTAWTGDSSTGDSTGTASTVPESTSMVGITLAVLLLPRRRRN